MLSIKCDGTSAETQLIADQRGAEIRNGRRTISAGGGYVTYRIGTGKCTPERIDYSVSMTSYSLDFSPDGRTWSRMGLFPQRDEEPDRFSRCANGIVPEWQKAAKKTGMAYFRFTRLPGSKAPLSLESIRFVVTGAPFPKGFQPAPEDLQSWLSHGEYPRAWSRTAALMILVGLLASLVSRWRWKTPLRLFGLGALLWTVSVAVKSGLAVLLNKPMESLLHQALPKFPADLVFWSYIGLLTGITEVGIFLAMAKWFQRRQWSWRDAASVGVGFGAIEAILLGVAVAVPVAMGKMPDPGTLAPVLERSLTIFIHVVTVVAPIYAITRHKWGWFAFAFFYKSAVDATAAYMLLAGSHLLAVHLWAVELGIFGPFAYIAIPILLILKKRWERGAEPKPAATMGPEVSSRGLAEGGGDASAG